MISIEMLSKDMPYIDMQSIYIIYDIYRWLRLLVLQFLQCIDACLYIYIYIYISYIIYTIVYYSILLYIT